jgi:phage repressor protein C with HTH and peptisase S24 domain
MNENRLKTIRTELGGISQAKLAANVGVPAHKIKDAESGRVKISTEIAQLVEEKLGYNFRWVMTGEGPKKKGKAQHQVIPVQPDFPADDFVFIRQVNGKISAGGGLMPDNSADLQCAFRRDWIKKRGGKPDNMSLIKVSGDSMAPTLLSGDLVLVDHSRTAVTPQGGIYAISIDHEIMIKRIQVLFPQNKLRILSDNSHYDPIEADPDQVKINGRVIWYGREI